MGLFNYGKNAESGSRMTEVWELLRLSPEKYRVLNKFVGHLCTSCLLDQCHHMWYQNKQHYSFYHQSLILEN